MPSCFVSTQISERMTILSRSMSRNDPKSRTAELHCEYESDQCPRSAVLVSRWFTNYNALRFRFSLRTCMLMMKLLCSSCCVVESRFWIRSNNNLWAGLQCDVFFPISGLCSLRDSVSAASCQACLPWYRKRKSSNYFFNLVKKRWGVENLPKSTKTRRPPRRTRSIGESVSLPF